MTKVMLCVHMVLHDEKEPSQAGCIWLRELSHIYHLSIQARESCDLSRLQCLRSFLHGLSIFQLAILTRHARRS